MTIDPSRVLTLRRDEQGPDGTFGTMIVPGRPRRPPLILQTMEDDWLLNRVGASAIPSGVYALMRTLFVKHQIETFEVMDVPGRTRILIHVANTEEDVQGCIGVGLRRGLLLVADEDSPLRPRVMKRAVLESRDAFHRFMLQMAGIDHAQLDVRWVPGLPLSSQESIT